MVGNDVLGSLGSQLSGVLEYDLYVAIGNGSFNKFATVPATAPSAIYRASSNQTLFFRSVARDVAGNTESDLVVNADTQITVGDFDPPVTQVTSATPNSFGLFSVSISGTDSGGGQLRFLDLYVAVDGGTAELISSAVAGSPNVQGVFTASTNYQGRADGIAHTYRFFSIGRDTAGNIEAAPSKAFDIVTTNTFASGVLRATGIDVQLGAAQRSYIRYLDILFSDEAGLSDLLLLNPLKLERFALNATDVTANTGTLVATPGITKVGDRLRLDFGSNGITGSRTTNTGDGFYRVLVDGNADGDYTDAVDSVFEFVRLLGDSTGNAVVDAADLAVVNAQFGRSAPTINAPGLNGDTDGSGAVNTSDRSRTTASQNRALATPLLAFLDD